MPSLVSLPKKLIPSALKKKKQGDGPDEADAESVEFNVPTPDHSPTREISEAELGMDADAGVDKEAIAKLIAEHGSSANTSWLEFSRYKLWTADEDIAPSSFRPVQGYLRNDPYVFAWGNPLVSDPAALEPTCLAFWKWCKARKLKLVWCCVDESMERVLGKGSKFNWSTVSCIVEDVLDPHNVVELARGQGGGSEIKDFKKNIRRAEREGVEAREIQYDAWTDAQKKEVEDGIRAWKDAKSGIQLASTSFQPWVDSEHRRYWVAEKDEKIVGILILSQIGGGQYQIKNAASFPDAPRGTSEFLIYSTMADLEDENEDGDAPMVWEEEDRQARAAERGNQADDASRSQSRASEDSGASSGRPSRVTVTFGITASEEMNAESNVGGWRVSWLSKTYSKVVGATGITKRGDFRNKFHTEHVPMYVCYPSKQGFGLDAVTKLMKCLRQ